MTRAARNARTSALSALARAPTASALAALALAALALAVAALAGPAAARAATTYVALGDSFTAAAGVPPLAPDAPVDCVRSAADYPHLTAAALGLALTDVSCSGATVGSMTAAQRSDDPPQFDALQAATGVVSVAIGYNDLGFSGYVLECELLDAAQPTAPACRQHYSPGGVDSTYAVVDRLGPEIAGVLAGIRARAPHARVLLLGYPDVLPATTGCWPAVAISAADTAWLNGVELRFNAVIAQQARAGGATFLDTYGPSVGHDVCRPAGSKWIEGIVPSSPAVPLHPNALGEQAIAAELEQALKQPPAPAPVKRHRPRRHHARHPRHARHRRARHHRRP